MWIQLAPHKQLWITRGEGVPVTSRLRTPCVRVERMTIVVSTDGSALGNPNAEPSSGKSGGFSVGEVSGPAREGAVRIDRKASMA
ncbi:hypothetical protein DF196_02945 [Bifidobacterium callitrichidarum]|uniref:Uncharacterized protein n=1 Tax=Bifidobacterium callitrichidarum TaxID=2052941 RepID=A0A2U2NBQ9_9BIFI|nr:hypothetical protein DF196_02945 [Bifidobacterium callitrichidarum]